ncbi:alkyl hydroperoxide reductase subunit C [Escherichia coli]|uniref:Alkyl hydroperoxide reductase subunit C n=1 Tax=Escherichia coli TaxID=562 RepID=A0A376RMV5_ECOLX|nr:alkyl hydroperoxide reductase subunit C [Escherichia coli]
MIGDPTGALTRNFDNMREDEGLADRATFVVDPQGIIQAIEVTAEGMAVTRLTCCVKSKQHST